MVFSDTCKHSKALNLRFILAGRMCGKESAGLETICGVMGLPPPVFQKCFTEYNLVIQKIANEVCEDSFRSCSAQLRGLQGAGPHDVVDCTVTCDGFWSRRGFVANYGVVAVLSWETGQVLDVVVLSKLCKVCKEAEHSDGVPGRMVKHQDSCNSNYTGSSHAMEAEGASILWARSDEKYKLQYTVLISDGDAKTISRLNSEHPYGTDIEIQVSTYMFILFILW